MSVEMYLKYANQSMEQFRGMFSEIAEKQVKMRLALEKIADLESVEIEQEKIDEEYEKLSGYYNMPAEKVKTLISEDTLNRDLKAERAMEIVKENAKKIKGDK
jgi:trigger factor